MELQKKEPGAPLFDAPVSLYFFLPFHPRDKAEGQ
jgi:hypothetical protein